MKFAIAALIVTATMLIFQFPVVAQSPSQPFTPDASTAGLWHLDGNANDASGNGHNGSVNSPTWPSGRFGNALQTGSSYISVPSAPDLDLTTGSFTIECWANAQPSPGAYRYIIAKRINSSSTDNSQYALYTGDGGEQLTFFVTSASGANIVRVDAPNFHWDGDWHHIAGVRDVTEGELRLYVDGQLLGTTPLSGSLYSSSNYPLGIGNHVNSTTPAHEFVGLIDEVRISNVARTYTALPDCEPQSKFATPYAPDNCTVGLWHVDEGSGTDIVDATGGGSNGRLYTVGWGTHIEPTADFGKCLVFDDHDSAKITLDNTSFITGSHTIEAWIRPSVTNVIQTVLCLYSSSEQVQIPIKVHEDGKVSFRVCGQGSQWDEIKGTTSLEPGVWYHVAGVWDQSTHEMAVYVNGEKENSKVLSYSPASLRNSTLDLGKMWTTQSVPNGAAEYFSGSIDEVRISSVARTFAATEPPVVKITNPAGGEEWTVGEKRMIRWTLSGGPTDQIEIYVSRTAGLTWGFITGFSSTMASEYEWTLNGPASSYCRIRVVASGPGGVSESLSPDFGVMESTGGRGVYVDYFELIVGNESRENSLLEFVERNDIRRLSLYGVRNEASNWINNASLSSFIQRAKQKGVSIIGAVGGNREDFEPIPVYNKNNPDNMIRVLNLEDEFWRTGDFSAYLMKLEYLHQMQTSNPGMRFEVETYHGYPNELQAAQTMLYVNRLFLHSYARNGSEAFNTGWTTRLGYFRNSYGVLGLYPLFSNEPVFMGPEICHDRSTGRYGIDYGAIPDLEAQFEILYRAAYPQENNVVLKGFQWFKYSSFIISVDALNGSPAPKEISSSTQYHFSGVLATSDILKPELNIARINVYLLDPGGDTIPVYRMDYERIDPFAGNNFDIASSIGTQVSVGVLDLSRISPDLKYRWEIQIVHPQVVTHEIVRASPGAEPALECEIGADLRFVKRSPIDLRVIDPTGRSIDRRESNITCAWYDEYPIASDDSGATVGIPFPDEGVYTVQILPKSVAGSGDTYTVFSVSDSDTTWLAIDTHISDIPAEGYLYSTLDTGSVCGTVTSNSTGLLGIPVDLSDLASTNVASTVTDVSGHYCFAGLNNGDYAVSIVTPLGFQADQETKQIKVKGLPHTVNFELMKTQVVVAPRTRAYWANQLQKALQNKPCDFSKAKFSRFASLINQHFNQNPVNPIDFYSVTQPASQDDSLTEMKSLLNMCGGVQEPFIKKFAKAQLMALMLNVVSGKLSQAEAITSDRNTVSQVVTYCDMLVNDEIDPPDDGGPGFGQQFARYIRADFILTLVNLRLPVPAGMIPNDVVQIMYRQAEQNPLPTEFSLSQNHPNPFNPTTEIGFAIPRSTHVKLEVLNILGQSIRTLLDEHKAAGNYQVNWDGRDNKNQSVASGIYLYRISAAEYTETRKMILMK